MGRLSSQNEVGRSAFKILTGKTAGKRTVERPKRRWEDNFRLCVKEISIYMRNWVDSDHVRDYWRVLPNAALNLVH